MKRSLLFLALLPIVLSAAGLPSVADTIIIREWLRCGPFPVGMREGITGVVEDPATFRPAEGETLRSSLVQGGLAVCRKIKLDSLGWLATDYDSVRWDSIQAYYGNAGVYCGGFAYAEFESPRACRAVALTPKLGSFYLNGLSYAGDVYGHNWLQVPVVLDSGTNRVLLNLFGYGDQQVKFRLAPVPSPVLLPRDFTLPELVESESLDSWLGVPLVNATEQRLDWVHVWVEDRTNFRVADTTILNLPALGAKKIPLRLVLPPAKYDSAGLRLVIRAEAPPGPAAVETLRLNIRHPNEARKVTFISGIDGSCQYYGILYPKDYDPNWQYGLILSLHGAGVEAIGQVASYKAKDWAFCVAATNRRPYGFNWQDWGRLDAREVLRAASRGRPIDPDRVLLTGHSMGGHGVWHVATTHPDLFAGAAAEAGWPSLQLYIPWFLQRSINFADPAQLAIRDMALRPDNPPAMLVNTANLPLFILHGGDDDNVPTLHGRNFAGWLDELGYRYTYKEVPGRGHWWSYEKENLSVLDDPDVMAFLKSQRREPFPGHILFRTADLGTSCRQYWAEIERVAVVGRDAEFEGWAGDSVIRIRTKNIDRFRLTLPEGKPTGFMVDGTRLAAKQGAGEFSFIRSAAGWKLVTKSGTGKTPTQYGPAKQVMMQPFLLVYGTGDTGLTRFLRHAATQEALRWWVNGNGMADVRPDTEVTAAMIDRYNLVLYGGSRENALAQRIEPRLPVHVQAGRMMCGTTDLGDSLAAICVYPNPLAPRRLVLLRTGTDPASTRLSLFWGIAGPSTGVPDFMVFDRSVRRYGWAGVRAAGFFDPDWNLSPESMYLSK